MPLQARLGLLFSFSTYLRFLSTASLSGGEISFLSPGGRAAAPGFTHNWLTRLQRGREPVPLVSFPYPVPKTAQRAAQGRVLVFSPERAYPSPFRGRGEVSPVWFAGFFTQRSPVLFRRKRRILRIRGLLLAVALATAAHNWLTRLQRGRFRALVVSFPYPSSKPHTGPHRAELGISPLFPGMFLPWQSCQLAFQVVVDSFLNGEDRVKQRPVSRSAVQCPHRCRQRFDEILIL